MKSKTQKQKIFDLVVNNPGLTATQYTRLLKFKACKNPTIKNNCNWYYKPATVLRELHRMVEKGELFRIKKPGVRPTVFAWRFYHYL